ncbi:MAG: aromatic ring-hydroxylating dioxygenase subunit alpha [Rhodospirillales bacterium]
MMPGHTAEKIQTLVESGRIHSSLYTDPEFFAGEMSEIFEKAWVFVAHESELKENGSFLRRTVGLQPVIVTRARTGIHVLVNRCSHRGNLVCAPERGVKRAFSCPYHGWVFAQNGDLVDVPFPEGCKDLDRNASGLKTAKVASYRGFVFATFNESPPSLEDYLGEARQALDRAADLSPSGEIELGRTWVRHLFRANWKMLSENEADGYHVTFVHDSFAKAINRQGKYDSILQDSEDKVEAVCRYLGGGHTELDYERTYSEPMTWLGVKPDRYPDYVSAMNETYGQDQAFEIMRRGPPHTFIFPNLFLAETCLVMIQPTSVGETVNWHTPLYLKDVPEALNRRILRQGEVALGPSAFLTADDAVIAERQWRATGGSPGWLDISRGQHREEVNPAGVVESHYSDEASNRGFWEHYRSLFAT